MYQRHGHCDYRVQELSFFLILKNLKRVASPFNPVVTKTDEGQTSCLLAG
jgi:hypothetical protein